ncbi:nitrite reductase/ring-hydroxylating ferredoxin subunit [Actinomadura luteofluorescens]|uniref:Nitrite reductase/ring-hydroxylating ferredoxin subunit n=2 Tax=Actinomadura luteofluorescens TaxID=46163 RepID=A0A7Y9EBX0_9ACTN|nr:non-heme iron oxygenase ferredoxin subunit [Actinomadura luteofluorescens]NYD44853.1 nitrite reductase/ring-hydroxylating ferredoxin subunit [Actinomadura luteofluorescens]
MSADLRSTGGRTVLCAADDVPPGRMLRVVTGDAGPLLVSNVNGTIHVTDDTCTHAEASLSEGDLEADRVVCPVHWAEFDLATGKALCFPASRPLAVYRAVVEDGMVVAFLARRSA